MASPIIAGNWKMNTTVAEGRELLSGMKLGLEAVEGIGVVVCPPFPALYPLSEMLKGSSIALGAQDVYFESSGAYTGEVSPGMLAELCEYVIVGHSERRHVLGESDALVSRKVEAALTAGLRPILCVGETLDQREGGIAEATVERQVRLGLSRVASLEGLVVAYEPVWAIGTGKAATTDDAQEIMAHIRGHLAQRASDSAASDVPILYGGSVTEDNVAGFVRQPDVDGALVGGASLKPDSFVELARRAAAAMR